MKRILLATVALIGLSGVAMATPMHTFTCSGEFNEGEGMAGIQIANCHIPAASPAQAKVEKVCEEGSICLVIGEGTQNHYGAIELKKIHRVVSLKTINKKTCFETGTCFSS